MISNKHFNLSSNSRKNNHHKMIFAYAFIVSKFLYIHKILAMKITKANIVESGGDRGGGGAGLVESCL